MENVIEQRNVYHRVARHIEESELCMVTLPCKYKDKSLKITVEVVGVPPRDVA